MHRNGETFHLTGQVTFICALRCIWGSDLLFPVAGTNQFINRKQVWQRKWTKMRWFTSWRCNNHRSQTGMLLSSNRRWKQHHDRRRDRREPARSWRDAAENRRQKWIRVWEQKKKRAVLGGETEERWVRGEYEKWTIMERSAEEKERPGVTLGVKVQ